MRVWAQLYLGMRVKSPSGHTQPQQRLFVFSRELKAEVRVYADFPPSLPEKKAIKDVLMFL